MDAPQADKLSTTRRFVANFVTLLSGNVGATVLAMMATAINARALGLTEFGTVALLQTSALLIAGVFSFATQQAVIKLGIAALANRQQDRFNMVLGMGFLADAVGALLAGIVGIAILYFLPSLLGLPPDLRPEALIVACALFLQGFRTSEAILRTYDAFKLLAWIQLAAAAVSLAVATILWVTEADFIFYAIFVAMTVSLPSLLQLLGSFVLLARKGARPTLGGKSLPPHLRREFIAYCWTTSAMGTADTVRQNGDVPLVAMLVSVEAAGIYNVCRQMAGALRKVSMVYASVLFPQLATYAAQGQGEAARRAMAKVLKATSALGLVFVTGAALAGAPLLEIVFGPQFRAGAPVLVLLSLAATLQIVSATYSMYVQAFDGPLGVLYGYLVALVTFIAVAIPAMSILGLLGAGAAQIAFFLVLAAFCRARLARCSQWKETPRR